MKKAEGNRFLFTKWGIPIFKGSSCQQINFLNLKKKKKILQEVNAYRDGEFVRFN